MDDENVVEPALPRVEEVQEGKCSGEDGAIRVATTEIPPLAAEWLAQQLCEEQVQAEA